MFLTNNPGELGPALDLPPRWEPASAESLPSAERTIFRAFAPESDVWSQESGDPFWRHVFLIDRARGSQFDTLRELLSGPLAAERDRGPVAALALTGTGFHGQRGRRWAAERGNLHLCAAIAPRVPVSKFALSMTTLPSLVAVDTIREVSGKQLDPGIKWVNDVVLEGRKVAGVLTATQSLGGLLETAIFGIGMNVERAPTVSPTPFVPEAGCLQGRAGGEKVSFAAVVRAALDAFARRIDQLTLDGPEELVADYLNESRWLLGRTVRIYPEGLDDTAPSGDWPPPDARGVLREIRRDLGLVLEGSPDPVHRGRLALEENCLALGLP